jgi:hypothetical protein
MRITLSGADQECLERLGTRYNELCDHDDGDNSDEIAGQLQAIEAEMALLEREVYRPEQIAIAGAFVWLDRTRGLRLSLILREHISTLRVRLAIVCRVSDSVLVAPALAVSPSPRPVASYFGRVSKERILEAVREGVSPEAATNIATMKKQATAEAAERRLAGTGRLPDLLRTGSDAAPATQQAAAVAKPDTLIVDGPAFSWQRLCDLAAQQLEA